MSQSSEVAIHVAALSKMFKIYNQPADMFWEVVRSKPMFKPFWALQDISFDVRRGQVVGLIGRNGAGKSTLLKIITGTLDKTAGTLEVQGRISSILELGSGFNGEYSGRENIYLGGLMVGLTPAEIAAKEEWIIEFSELEDFIEQPFKTYSTGMQARLTFATAVCVDPDILIVDEALSVGDARFQRKSFNKIEEFREAGNTILLVSHDINTVNTFCDYAILLENGKILEQGEPQWISKIYYQMLFASQPASGEESVEEDQAAAIEIPLAPSLMTPEIGQSWQVPLADWDVVGDSPHHPRRSKFLLFEDDKPLRPAHWPHAQIRENGKGAYSHWGKQLYFSTSDNSDPRANGRAYVLRHQKLVKAKLAPQNETLTPDRERLRQSALQKLGLGAPYIQGNSRLLRIGNGKAEILDYGILDSRGERPNYLTSGEPYTLFFRAVYYEDVEAASAGFLIRSIKGIDMFGATMRSLNILTPPRKMGETVQVNLHVTMWLTNGVYFLTVNTADPNAESNVQYDSLYDGYQFEVTRKPGILHASIVDLDARLEVLEFVEEAKGLATGSSSPQHYPKTSIQNVCPRAFQS